MANSSEQYVNRFTGRAEIYSKYRPHYPQRIIEILRKTISFDDKVVVADVGSGTGILSQLFLQNGNKVYCVEPNKDMRSFATKQLSRYPGFISVTGTAEDTTLEENSVDLIAVGQALHWFDLDRAKVEFLRILTKNGHIMIVYNDRKKNEHGLMEDYEQIITRYAKNRPDVREFPEDDYIKKFLNSPDYRKFELSNYQLLDCEGLIGRAGSASYSPTPKDNEFSSFKRDLSDLYSKYQENGRVKMIYKTMLFLGCPGRN
jgi:SAM-dependent methyltransferase